MIVSKVNYGRIGCFYSPILIMFLVKRLSQPAGRVGNPLDIANMVLYLASDKAGFITGENICIDGGMTKQMIYHNDFGWSLE